MAREPGREGERPGGDALEVRPAVSRRDLKRFHRVPWRIYPGRYPAWVPPLLVEERERLDRRRNPFFEHGEVVPFLATRRGRVVGRIAAIENRLHNEVHGDRVGFFGLFECEEDSEAARALLDAVAAWLADRGLTTVRGPATLSMNEIVGLLLDDFADPPTILMPFNPPYYAALLESWGLRKAKDLRAYWSSTAGFHEERFAGLERVVARSRHELSVRRLRKRRFQEEVELIRDLYNRAWERNWGFVPMTDGEIDRMARQLKPILDPELALIGEVNGQPAGFALALPDVNQALHKLNGRLFPFGLVKLFWYLRRVTRVRILTLGVEPEHRKSGLDALLYLQIFRAAVTRGYVGGESSWILEDNRVMCRALEKMGFVLRKTYRIYERALARPSRPVWARVQEADPA